MVFLIQSLLEGGNGDWGRESQRLSRKENFASVMLAGAEEQHAGVESTDSGELDRFKKKEKCGENKEQSEPHYVTST